VELKKKRIWKDSREGHIDAIKYLIDRQQGTINSIRTPWHKVNEATVDGLEWNTINVIAGRPGTGKTAIKDQIIRESFKLNPKEKFRVLEFQLEMLARTSAIREYSSVIGKTYKQMCSADGILSKEDIEKCRLHARIKVLDPVDVVETAPNVTEFEEIIDNYMEDYHYYQDVIQKDNTTVSTKFYRKTIITLDHSILLKKGAKEKDKTEMLQNLGECLTKLKKKYPIIFIILSQLNRNIDSPERNEDGKYGNYILASDIFGGDALLMHADVVIGLNIPGKQNIHFYGPERYMITDKSTLIMHFIKCRNGEVQIGFFQEKFSEMKIIEIPVPPTQSRRVSTI
jgi:replicative DNA helicase